MTCSPRQEPAVLLLGLLGGGEAASIDAGGGRSGDDAPIVCFADSAGCSQGSGSRDSSRIRLGIIATPRA